MSRSLRIIFAGTPDFAAEHLRSLLDTQHEICAVLTQPDRPAGRGRKPLPSPVKSLALNHGLPVHQPLSLKTPEAADLLQSLNADLMVVVAYGLLLPKNILSMPTRGCINVHASILPRWRGAAPIQRAIEAGDRQTGVCIMQMDEGLDTGDVWLCHYCDIEPNDNAQILHDRLVAMGQVALPLAIEQILSGQASPQQQSSEGIEYAHKLSKDDAIIDWTTSNRAIADKIRAFNPWPVACSDLHDKKVRIWQARAIDEPHSQTPGTVLRLEKQAIIVACGEGAIAIEQMQLPNAKRLDVAAVLNSKKDLFEPGSQFTAG